MTYTHFTDYQAQIKKVFDRKGKGKTILGWGHGLVVGQEK
jgi:hypothetical protein